MTILASCAYTLHSFSEVTAFFLMSLWSCDQLFLSLKCLIGKHLEINGFHRETGCTICQKKEGGHEWPHVNNSASPSFLKI